MVGNVLFITTRNLKPWSGKRDAPSPTQLDLSDILIMVVSHMRSMSIQHLPSCRGYGSTLHTGGYPSIPDLQVFAGLGLGSAIVCARFAQAGLPRRRVGIFNAAFGVVIACLVLACASVAH